VDHSEVCQIVALDSLWGEQSCLAWLPRRDAVVRVSPSRLQELERIPQTPHQLAYVTAAARIADALERDALVAPIQTSVIPLPHQLHALSRAMAGDRIRYLLADEVGLGKTIEAGLILRELKIRGLVRRTLVVAPAGLVTQWVSELRTHFDEDFRLVIPGDFSAWRQIAAVEDGENLWRLHDQVVCPVDSVKPLDSRRGWSSQQVARYNQERLENLVTAGWDLVIVDEAHRLGGSTEQVARYRLGEALAQAAPYLLLLSATPHQGKTDAFRRLLGLLDHEAFPSDEVVCQQTVAPYVIRTEKRQAIDAEGNPLFQPRHTQLVHVDWAAGYQDQKVMYDAVTDYVREGYDQARRSKKAAVGFLMILMQRLVTSSTRAIRTALERRLQVLKLPEGQLSLFPEDVGEQWAGLDSQEQMESLLSSRLKGLKNERAEVELLLSAARRCEARGPDVKAQALLDSIHRLQREEGDADLKVLVFTEFVPTQQMLAEFLGNRGFSVVCLNGSLDLDQRCEVQRAFAEDARVLVSTDAGGEGLNLQFCHVVFNYDLPWNPMKLEQRIGRVDRIGQTHVVRAQNLALEGTVELRVREVLEEKLERILEEFGVDKLADVLDSEEGGVDFDDLYMSAVLTPAEAEARATELAERVRERAQAARDGSKLLGATSSLDPAAALRVAEGQVPYWTERMTVAYLRSRSSDGGSAEADEVGYRLSWPGGATHTRAVFARRDAELNGTTLLTLEHPEIRSLVARLPVFAPGQPLLGIVLDGISERVTGTWSLWKIALRTAESRALRVLPLFVSDDGRVLAPTSRAILDRLVEIDQGAVPIVPYACRGEEARARYDVSRAQAEAQGRSLFEELMAAQRERLEREREKAQRAFTARRRAVGRIGLPQVRKHRLSEIEKDEADSSARLKAMADVLPELTALVLVQVLPVGSAT
jgi:superfamily II DNA or RNA helicase